MNVNFTYFTIKNDKNSILRPYDGLITQKIERDLRDTIFVTYVTHFQMPISLEILNLLPWIFFWWVTCLRRDKLSRSHWILYRIRWMAQLFELKTWPTWRSSWCAFSEKSTWRIFVKFSQHDHVPRVSLYWKGWVDILKNGWIREILLKSDILDVESCSRFTWKIFKFYDILTCSEIRIMKGTPFLYNIHIKLDHKNLFQNLKKFLWWALNVELAI